MAVPLPSAESIAHRARLASLVSQLRPTHFRTHLTRLPAHRIPTLWTLYRGVLRDAPNDTIRSRMRAFFRDRRTMRVQGDITRELRKAHKWWDIFKKARSGDSHFQVVCERYARMLEGARLQQRADGVYEEELAWYERMRTRPIMTGGYLKPSLFNGPLPRLVPQPMHISGMITSRKKARERRLFNLDTFTEDMKLIYHECKFEEMLAGRMAADGASFERIFADDVAAWRQPIKEVLDGMHASFERERSRVAQPFPPELLQAIKAARREKVANKTRERERERRGELTANLARRMRQRPPPHRLQQMSPRQRRMDVISRGASEVGYVGLVKRRLGHKLRDPDAWKAELGSPDGRGKLDKMANEIEKENVRRRVAVEGAGTDDQSRSLPPRAYLGTND